MTLNKKKKAIIIAAAALAAAAVIGTAVYFLVIKNKDDVSKDEICEQATATLSEIVSDSKIPDKEYDNLDLSEAVLNIPNVDKLNKYYAPLDDNLTPEECNKKCYELFDDIFYYAKEEHPDTVFEDGYGNPLPDGEAVEQYINGNGPFSLSYIWFEVEEDTGYSCRCDAEGRFIMYESATIDIRYDDSTEVEQIIHLDRGEQAPDTQYTVNGEKYSPAQALEFAQGVAADKLSKYVDAPLSPTELVIHKNAGSDNYFYIVQFEYVYDGMPYFHLSAPKALENMWNVYKVLYMTITTPNRIGEIYNMIEDNGFEKDGKYTDKYIPLETAIDIANQYLAQYYRQKISEVAIKYVVVSEPIDGWAFADGYQPEDDAYKEKRRLRPCWCFIIDKTNPYHGDYCLCGKAITVDMQTGKVYTFIENVLY